MENLIELLKKIITNVLTALYQPFWFAVILTVFLLFFYLYAYKLQIMFKRNASSATAERLFHF